MSAKPDDQFEKLLGLLQRLKEAKIPHSLGDYREGAVSVVAYAPGEYWEIDFLPDGDVDVERYRSRGAIEGESVLDELFTLWAADEPLSPAPVSQDAATAG